MPEDVLLEPVALWALFVLGLELIILALATAAVGWQNTKESEKWLGNFFHPAFTTAWWRIHLLGALIILLVAVMDFIHITQGN